MDDIRSPGVLDDPAALIRLALADDEAAFARIVRLHRDVMVRVAYVVVGDVEMALRAVAETWPIAWSRLGHLPDPTRLGPWLCAIAAREARGLARRGGGDAPAFRAPAGDRPASDPRAMDPKLVATLGRLDVDDRVLLALRHVAGLSTAELGRAARLTPAAAQARLVALQETLVGPVAGDEAGRTAEERTGAWLRELADVPVAPAPIDAVARSARVLRHDRRIRVVSVAVAIAAAVVVTGLPIVLPPPEPGPAVKSLFASPSPVPTTDPRPSASDDFP